MEADDFEPPVVGVTEAVKRRALDAAPLGVVITDPTVEDNPVVYANDAFYRLTGYDPEEVLGRNCRFLQGPETSPACVAELRDAVEAGEPVSTVIRNYRRDGTHFWNHVEITPLTDEDGAITQFVGFQHEVTELKEREIELERRQQRFERLHRASRRFMDAESVDEVARIAAEAAAETLGYPLATLRFADASVDRLRATATTAECEAVVGERPDYRADGPTPVAAVYRTGEPRIEDDLDAVDDGYDRGDLASGMYLPIGEYGVVSVGSTRPAAFDDRDLETVGVLAKLAAGAVSRLESERTIQRRNERLERFANIVAHDLRNPLGIARGRLELAQETYDDEDLDAVARAQTRMSALIEDLLTLARDGGPVTDDDAEPVELARIVRDCWQLVETPGVRLQIDGTCTLQADEGRLRRLLENLIRNAVEHGSTTKPAVDDTVEHGTITGGAGGSSETNETGDTSHEAPHGTGTTDPVTIRVGVIEDFARSASATAPDRPSSRGFYVEDDGVGIPPERRGRVFDDGYSTHPSGTGFGLAIVEEIAEAHGWSVHLTDGADGGARFEFRSVEDPSPEPDPTDG
jgi:PAS domain S-box-containing protein